MRSNIIILALLLGSCATVQELPDPKVDCPRVPAELMQPPERPQPIKP